MTPAVITKHVDRLVRRGYVQRETDPDDRRRLRLTLTPAGHGLSDAGERAMAESLTARLAAFSPEELATLGAALALLERAFAVAEPGDPPAPSIRHDSHIEQEEPHDECNEDH